MAKPMASVEISHTINIPGIEGMLPALGAAVLEDEKEEMLAAIHAHWSGWKYIRYTRKDGTAKLWDEQYRGESGRAWQGAVQATENPFGIILENKAGSIYPGGKGKPYSGYVRRHKGAPLESEVVFKILTEQHVPQLRDRVIEFFMSEVFNPGPRKQVRVAQATAGAVDLGAIEL